jgi:hypothetical protein
MTQISGSRELAAMRMAVRERMVFGNACKGSGNRPTV